METLSQAERATLRAALEFYQSRGMGDAAYRARKIQEIATDGGEVVALDDDGIDRLREKLKK